MLDGHTGLRTWAPPKDALIYSPFETSQPRPPRSTSPMKQRSFASLSFDAKKKPTHREKFFGEMEKVVPRSDLLALVEPLIRC